MMIGSDILSSWKIIEYLYLASEWYFNMIYYDISKYIGIFNIIHYIVWNDIFRYINGIFLFYFIDIF